MFQNPDDGRFVVPLFTDEAKANFAARGNVRIIEGTGRAMLEAIRDTTVMLNPNDARCTLYPEEIAALLATGTVAPVRKHELEEGKARRYKLPERLVKALKTALPGIQGVTMAYVAGVKWRQDRHPDSLLIMLGGRADATEREVRAVATVLRRVIERLDRPVDLTHFDDDQPAPEWIQHLGLKPVFRRSLRPPAPVSRYN